MAQLAVCKTTGTILNLEDVMIVPDYTIPDEEVLSDSEICEIAVAHGISIRQLVETKASLALSRMQSGLRDCINNLPAEVMKDL